MVPQTETAEDEYEGKVGPNRRRMPIDRHGITHKVEIHDEIHGGVQEGYITANCQDDGTLGEVFLQGFGKSGSTLEGWVQLCALLLSTALQYGAEFPVLARKVSHMKFPPHGKTDNPDIPYCRSVPDYLMHWLVLRFGDDELGAELRKIDQELEGIV